MASHITVPRSTTPSRPDLGMADAGRLDETQRVAWGLRSKGQFSGCYGAS